MRRQGRVASVTEFDFVSHRKTSDRNVVVISDTTCTGIGDVGVSVRVDITFVPGLSEPCNELRVNKV